jgi:hypothetical protein
MTRPHHIFWSEPKNRRRNLDAAAETADELIRLSDELLWRYGRDIEADNGLVRCLAISEFLITTYAVQPDLTVYRISQLDNEQNISQLFAATWHSGSEIPDVQLYRDGPWEETFRKIGTEMTWVTPSELMMTKLR